MKFLNRCKKVIKKIFIYVFLFLEFDGNDQSFSFVIRMFSLQQNF